MRLLQSTQNLPLKIIKQNMQSAKSVSDFKRWQIIYSICAYNVDATYLADITGYSKANVYAVVQSFNKNKTANISVKQKGGRRRSLMSVEEEKALMKSFEDKALKGQILSAKDIKKTIEQTLNKTVSDDFVWDLFKRNGWTKQLKVPQNIILWFLPPYSPELNPVELMWRELRVKYFNNRTFQSMKELEDQLEYALIDFVKDKEAIKKLTKINYL